MLVESLIAMLQIVGMAKKQPNKARRTPQDWQMEDAKRLRALYNLKMKSGEIEKMSQEKFGATFFIGSQGMVWQYLHGTRPLNVEVATKFAKGLQTEVKDFSPFLAKKINDLTSGNIPEETRPQADARTLSEEALDLAKRWELLPPPERAFFYALISRELAIIDTGQPWFRMTAFGKPSYQKLEKKIEGSYLKLKRKAET